MKISFFQKDEKLDNAAIGSGVYIVKLRKKSERDPMPLYIGESVYMVKRCGEHLFKFDRNPELFGLADIFISDDRFELCFEVLESLPNAHKLKRKEVERKYIGEKRPLTQHSTNDKLVRDRVSIVEQKIKELWHG